MIFKKWGAMPPPVCPPCEGRGCPPWKKNPDHDTLLDMGFQNIYSFIMIHLHRPSLSRPKDFT